MEEIKKLESKRAQLSAEYEIDLRRSQELAGSITDMESRLESFGGNYERMLADFRSLRESLEADVAVLQTEKTNLENLIEEWELMLTNIKDDVASIKSQFDLIYQEKLSLQKSYETSSSDYSTKLAELEKKEKSLKISVTRLTAMDTALLERVSSNQELVEKLDSIVKALVIKKDNLTSDVAILEDRVKELYKINTPD